jgi:hypothetical protein
VRILRARTTPPEDCEGPDARATTGGTTAAGSSGNKLISHGFGRSPTSIIVVTLSDHLVTTARTATQVGVTWSRDTAGDHTRTGDS